MYKERPDSMAFIEDIMPSTDEEKATSEKWRTAGQRGGIREQRPQGGSQRPSESPRFSSHAVGPPPGFTQFQRGGSGSRVSELRLCRDL